MEKQNQENNSNLVHNFIIEIEQLPHHAKAKKSNRFSTENR